MGLEKHNIVDVIAYDPTEDRIVLGLLGLGHWGESGERLFEFVIKIKTYLAYALEGNLDDDYPELADKKIVIRLYHNHELGEPEQELVSAIESDYLRPAGIYWEQCILPTRLQIV
jgi:hypothetical protein